MPICNEFLCTPIGIIIMSITGISLFFCLLYFAKKKIIPYLRKQSTYLVDVRKIPKRKNPEKDPSESYRHKAKPQVKQIVNDSQFVMMENSLDASDNNISISITKEKNSPEVKKLGLMSSVDS